MSDVTPNYKTSNNEVTIETENLENRLATMIKTSHGSEAILANEIMKSIKSGCNNEVALKNIESQLTALYFEYQNKYGLQ